VKVLLGAMKVLITRCTWDSGAVSCGGIVEAVAMVVSSNFSGIVVFSLDRHQDQVGE
jgi:hypothetical protein